MEESIIMNFRITDEISKEDENDILQGILEYNLARIEDKNPKELGIYFENESGKKLAGLIGDTHGNWLSIKFLWVDKDIRGEKIGSKLLIQGEKIAKERGCKYVFLDTFSFQAPGFYRKHGYKEIFALEDYPITGKRYYFIKNLY